MDYFQILREQFVASYNKLNQDDDYYYFYKHLSIDDNFAVLGVFNNNELLYTNPTTFNDPYDCLCIFDYDFSNFKRADAEEIFKERITNKIFNSRKHIYIRRLKELHEIKKWGDLSRNTFYLTCFNNNPLNILMWSHYARNHEGFMLEFKFKKIKGYYANLPMPVFYNDEFPIIKVPFNISSQDCTDNPLLGSEFMIKRFLNKSKVWEYEQEFRVPNKSPMQGNQKNILVKYEPAELSTVIFGAKINEEHRLKIQLAVDEFNRVNESDVKTFRANLADRSYKLEVKDHPRL